MPLRQLSLVLISALALCFSSGAAAQPRAASTPHSRCAALTPAQIGAMDETIRSAIAANLVPGVSVGVGFNGATLLRAYGHADLENDVPVTDDTVFWVMSVNKIFIATSVVLLAERGQLNLDDPLARYLPAFPRAQQVTLRQLLGQTSGIREFLNQPAERRAMIEAQMRANPDRNVSELVDYMAALTPDVYEFEPGTAWKYSNSNYVLLGAVIQRVSGMPWQEFLRRNIFTPLGLRNTAIDALQEIVPHRARGYVRTQSGGFRNARDFPRNLAASAGSLRSTARDLLTWQLALMGGRVVTQADVRMMSEPMRLSNGQPVHAEQPASYGLGLWLNQEAGRRTVGLIGNFEGFETIVQTYPDHGLTLAVLTNTSGAATALSPRIAQAILDHAPGADAAARTCVRSTGN